MWSTDGAGAGACGTGGKYGLLTQMERCTGITLDTRQRKAAEHSRQLQIQQNSFIALFFMGVENSDWY
jgi:hypothetical protein